MFTGLVQDIGTVQSINRSGDWRLMIETNLDLSSIPDGASIMCSGVCLTVVEKEGRCFIVDVSHETLSKTVIGQWQDGESINLEPSLKIGDELGGHLVFGHVDGLAELVNIESDQDSYRLTMRSPKDCHHYIAKKGSVTLDGISLTVNEVDAETFNVNIIPHTWTHTTLQYRQKGDHLNFEVDMLARYVERIIGQ